MKKLKFSDINKRHATLLGLIAVVAVAGVVNLNMANKTVETMANTGVLGTQTAIETDSSEEKKEDYFSDAVLERDSKRSKSMEVYREIVNSENCDRETKENAQAMLTKSAEYINDENVIETLIKAKGISKCVAYIDEDCVNIIVFDTKLTSEDANKIKDIVTENTDFTADKIKITEN